jgi:GTP-binding protein HflX
MVFNKIDAYTFVPKDDDDLTERTRENIPLEEWQRTWVNKTGENTVFISAVNRLNIEELRHKIYDVAAQIHMQRFPYNDFLFEYYNEEEN